MYTRTSGAHADLPPRESNIAKKVRRRFVAKRPIFIRYYFPFRLDEAGKSVGPGVQLCEGILVTRQIFRLVVAVRFVFSKFNVLPQRVWNFHAAVLALPHQWCITVAIVFERFLLGIEIMFVSIVEELGPTCRIEFVSAAITITEKRCRPALEMVQAHRLPLG